MPNYTPGRKREIEFISHQERKNTDIFIPFNDSSLKFKLILKRQKAP